MADGRFYATASCITQGWIALGFAANTADAVVSGDWINSNVDEGVSDSWKTANAESPALDTSLGGFDNVQGYVSRTSSGRADLTISRLLSTGDIYDKTLVTDSLLALTGACSATANRAFVWAPTNGTRRSIHGSGLYAFRYTTVNIIIGTGYVQYIDQSYILAHGLLMMIGFGVCYLLGICIAWLVPHKYSLWFWLHAAASLLGTALIIAGFAMAVSMVANANQPQWSLASRTQGAHAVLGIIAFVWALLQGTLGMLSKLLWTLEFRRTAALPAVKVFPDQLHWWSGRLLFVLGLVNPFLGLWEWGIPPGWLGLWGGYCALVVVLFIVCFVWKRASRKTQAADVSSYYAKSAIPLERVSRGSFTAGSTKAAAAAAATAVPGNNAQTDAGSEEAALHSNPQPRRDTTSAEELPRDHNTEPAPERGAESAPVAVVEAVPGPSDTAGKAGPPPAGVVAVPPVARTGDSDPRRAEVLSSSVDALSDVSPRAARGSPPSQPIKPTEPIKPAAITVSEQRRVVDLSGQSNGQAISDSLPVALQPRAATNAALVRLLVWTLCVHVYMYVYI